ncbi:predicted protein [Botrytis cinerea T4]|uniref:Uncharacterized protein n=1 Tax=Botryotinia fuckeliana (strain T4) TaxID=999810 RepID=G2Y000_BOTF4|nr:predicted protein [Botrytis cinerea T4]
MEEKDRNSCFSQERSMRILERTFHNAEKNLRFNLPEYSSREPHDLEFQHHQYLTMRPHH